MTLGHVSSRYHQSLRNQFICKGAVVPIDSAKLMVLFSIDTGLEPLGVTRLDHRTGSMYNLQPALKGWSVGGVPTSSSMPKLVSFL